MAFQKKLPLYILFMLLLSMFVFAQPEEYRITPFPGQDPASTSPPGRALAIPLAASNLGPSFQCSKDVASWHAFNAKAGNNQVGSKCPANSKINVYQCLNGYDITKQSCRNFNSRLFGTADKVGRINPELTMNAETYVYSCHICSQKDIVPDEEIGVGKNYCDARIWTGTDRSANCKLPQGQHFVIIDVKLKPSKKSFSADEKIEVEATIVNRGTSSGTMFVESRFDTQIPRAAGVTVEPLAAVGHPRDPGSCRIAEEKWGLVDTREVQLRPGGLQKLTFSLIVPGVDTFTNLESVDSDLRSQWGSFIKKLKRETGFGTNGYIWVQTYQRCWSDNYPNLEPGITASGYIPISVSGKSIRQGLLCDDRITNQDETCRDGGGKTCDKRCGERESCRIDTDCTGGLICGADKTCKKPVQEGPVGDFYCSGNTITRDVQDVTGKRTPSTIEECGEGFECVDRSDSCPTIPEIDDPLPPPEPPIEPPIDCFVTGDCEGEDDKDDLCGLAEDCPGVDICNDGVPQLGEEELCGVGGEDIVDAQECSTAADCPNDKFCDLDFGGKCVLVSVSEDDVVHPGQPGLGALKPCTDDTQCSARKSCVGNFPEIGGGVCVTLESGEFDFRKLFNATTYTILGGLAVLLILGIFFFRRKK